EIQPAREGEDLGQRQTLLAKLAGQGEGRVRIQQESGPDAADLGGREQENAAHRNPIRTNARAQASGSGVAWAFRPGVPPMKSRVVLHFTGGTPVARSRPIPTTNDRSLCGMGREARAT